MFRGVVNFFYTELHRVFFEVDCVKRVAQRRYTLLLQVMSYELRVSGISTSLDLTKERLLTSGYYLMAKQVNY